MLKEVTLSFRLDEESTAKLEELVKLTQLTRGQVLRQLIKGASVGAATFPVVMSSGAAVERTAQAAQ